MKKLIKLIIKGLINYFFYFLIILLERLKLYKIFRHAFNERNENKLYKINLKNKKKLFFYIPNELNEYRVKTFFSKEPNTLKWIDSFKKNSLFWDIGSNIGLYSCYAVKQKNCNVISFEPSVFNLNILAKNINVNNLQEKITILPIPLSDNLICSKFNMSDITTGGALSSFSKLTGFDGKNIKKRFSYMTYGLTIDYMIEKLKFKQPDYLKIDVDGIDHLVLKGGSNTIKNCKSILIEINLSFKQQYSFIKRIMKKNKFKLVDQARLVDDKNSAFYRCFNQVWSKK